MWSVREILESKSVAVIGASRDPEKPGAQLLKALKRARYQGRVADVNPQGGKFSKPTCITAWKRYLSLLTWRSYTFPLS
jgi:acyl-CoA synthetase (NDP forming)